MFQDLVDNYIAENQKEKLKVQIEKIYKYDSFEELYKNFDKISMGYKENDVADAKDMEQYYSIEEQKKYGVLAIEIKSIN